MRSLSSYERCTDGTWWPERALCTPCTQMLFFFAKGEERLKMTKVVDVAQDNLSLNPETGQTADEQVCPVNAGPMGLAENDVQMEEEVEAGLIVRPELFHRPGVSGLTVPIAVRQGVGFEQKWSLYLRHGSGRRECLGVSETLTLGNGQQLIFSFQPGAPDAVDCPWTQKGRQVWLRGYDPDLGLVFQNLAGLIRRFVEFPADKAEGILATVSLWTMMTYLYPIWPAVPYLSIGGPAGSGKSRIFDVLMELVFRPLASSSMTAPCLFRTLHQQGGTLLLDEAERLQEHCPEAGELRSILLAGYKANAKAHRLSAEVFRTMSFDVFGPKALACIAGLPPALVTRCIPIMMFRAASSSPVVRRRIRDYQREFQSVRDDLYAMALSYGQAILDGSGQSFPSNGLTARDCEIWQPLVDLAIFIESHGIVDLANQVVEFSTSLAESAQDDAVPESDEIILQTLIEMQTTRSSGITAGDILDRVKVSHLSLFSKFSPKGIGRRLSSYGINSVKNGGRRLFNPTQAELEKIQASYGIDLGIEPVIREEIEPDTDVPGPFSEGTSGTSGTSEEGPYG